jgi:hypothetical protein
MRSPSFRRRKLSAKRPRQPIRAWRVVERAGWRAELAMPLIYLPWIMFAATVSLLFDTSSERK